MNTTFENAPKRFKDAVMKLYNAYHNNELNSQDCKACVVGNICDNSGIWRNYAKYHTAYKTIVLYQEDLPLEILKFGYSKLELANIEKVFMESVETEETKENQFKGLCAVVEYLCELDNIENPMDFTKLFETENEKPKYELV